MRFQEVWLICCLVQSTKVGISLQQSYSLWHDIQLRVRLIKKRWSGRGEVHIVAVNCNFDGSKWNFNCNELDENGNWNEGNQFSSPETIDNAKPPDGLPEVFSFG